MHVYARVSVCVHVYVYVCVHNIIMLCLENVHSYMDWCGLLASSFPGNCVRFHIQLPRKWAYMMTLFEYCLDHSFRDFHWLIWTHHIKLYIHVCVCEWVSIVQHVSVCVCEWWWVCLSICVCHDNCSCTHQPQALPVAPHLLKVQPTIIAGCG